MQINKNLNLIFFQKFFICLVPFGLILGPFLADLFLVIGSILFIFQSFKINLKKYYNNKLLIFFWIYCIYLIILSLLSDNIFLSLESSLFYFRYGFFVLSIWFLLDSDKTFIKSFTIVLIFSFSFVILDSLIQFFFGFNILGLLLLFFGYELNLVHYLGFSYSEDRLSSVFW